MSTITRFVGRRELLRELGISKTTILRWTAVNRPGFVGDHQLK